jgi:hypothetical protein
MSRYGEQVRRARIVGEQAHDEAWGVVLLVMVAHEGHRRAPGAVVVELVDLERRHHAPSPGLAHQVAGRDRRGAAGIEEPVEHEHHREVGESVELGHVVDDVDQPVGIGHGNLSGRVGYSVQRPRPSAYSELSESELARTPEQGELALLRSRARVEERGSDPPPHRTASRACRQP